MDRGSESVCAVVDRFLTSEGADALILAFTSRTGRSVARWAPRIFLFGFFNRRGVYLRVLWACFQAPVVGGSQEGAGLGGIFAFFLADFLLGSAGAGARQH